MASASEANGGSEQVIEVPKQYNAAHDLLERNLRAGRGERIAFVDDRRAIGFDALATRVNRFASGLASIGIRAEDRVMICMLDSIDWVVAFLGSIKAGVVPVCVNTMLRPADYDYMLRDSRARALFVSRSLYPGFDGLLQSIQTLSRVVISEAPIADGGDFDALLAAGEGEFEPADTMADEPCFWLYSSGSTGQPKGTIHCHSSLIQTAELYARPILGIHERDRVFSAAKLFFAYGLGNALTFPLAVGASAVLMAERPTPKAVFERLTGALPAAADSEQPTVFFGVPTLFAGMLADPAFPARDALALRICASAGEALPEAIGKRFSERAGADVLDGIGSTEMLHIFLSNRSGAVRYGTTGSPVPGYRLRLLDDEGLEVADGEIGDLYIRGPSSALMYWNQRQRSKETFQGEWVKSGDKYVRSADGFYTYAGRSDDMLKVSGQYVSPFEVESALGTHEAVLEAAVVGHADDDALVKPKAFVVLKKGVEPGEPLAAELQAHVRRQLAPHKYPRWIEFVGELPKTATGKIQRFRLRSGADDG
ncbi:MAG: benzoate-CoA ligase family protein [Lautropia sp.]